MGGLQVTGNVPLRDPALSSSSSSLSSYALRVVLPHSFHCEVSTQVPKAKDGRPPTL